MPWRECNLMDERVKSIAQFLGSEKVARLACEFGISSKKAYKIIECYHDIGLARPALNRGGRRLQSRHVLLLPRRNGLQSAP